jgi:hypothetical protein
VRASALPISFLDLQQDQPERPATFERPAQRLEERHQRLLLRRAQAERAQLGIEMRIVIPPLGRRSR